MRSETVFSEEAMIHCKPSLNSTPDLRHKHMIELMFRQMVGVHLVALVDKRTRRGLLNNAPFLLFKMSSPSFLQFPENWIGWETFFMHEKLTTFHSPPRTKELASHIGGPDCHLRNGTSHNNWNGSSIITTLASGSFAGVPLSLSSPAWPCWQQC